MTALFLCSRKVLLFKLGLRLGELVALKESDIDFINQEVHIHRTETMELDDKGKTIITVVNQEIFMTF